MFSFKMTLALRRLFGLCPFCQEAKCRENGNKQQLLKRVKSQDGQLSGHLSELQEKSPVLAEGQPRKAELTAFDGNTSASMSQVIWKGFY